MQATNLALNKPVIVSSQGGNIAFHPPTAVNDADTSTNFFTRNLPWSFVAIDLETEYEIHCISLIVSNSGVSWILVHRFAKYDISMYQEAGPLFTSRRTPYWKISQTPESRRDWESLNPNPSEIWQAPRQQQCQDACQNPERYDHHNILCRGFTRSCGKTSVRLVNRGLGHELCLLGQLFDSIGRTMAFSMLLVCCDLIRWWTYMNPVWHSWVHTVRAIQSDTPYASVSFKGYAIFGIF